MKIEIYCDESRPELLTGNQPSSSQFSLLGSLWIPADNREIIKQNIKALRSEHGVWGELKWTKVTNAKLAFYKALVDMFFDQANLSFRAIAINSSNLDIKLHHNNDPELGYFKFYYQLLSHRLSAGDEYSIFLDHRKNRLPNRLHKLKLVLSRSKPQATVNNLQAIPSRESDLLQLCDILLGLTQSRLNSSNRGSVAKKELLSLAESRLGHVIQPTHVSESKFNVFQIRLES
jgi:hypothetical protein